MTAAFVLARLIVNHGLQARLTFLEQVLDPLAIGDFRLQRARLLFQQSNLAQPVLYGPALQAITLRGENMGMRLANAFKNFAVGRISKILHRIRAQERERMLLTE